MLRKSNIAVGAPSKKQAEILRFVTTFRKNKGYAPSLTEIASHFGVSVPTTHQHISYLRKKNLLTSEKGKQRSIQTFNTSSGNTIEIPLMGLIAAGGPIEPIRDPRPIEVPRNMIATKATYYALKIAGTSMIEDGIFDGDIVIIREQSTIEDGEKAVVYLPDKDAVTLKKVYREKDRFKLVPANHNMQPFYETNVEIQGKVMGVIRNEFQAS